MNNSLLVTYKINSKVNFKLLLLTVNIQCKQLYCHITGIVFWLLFPFNSSRSLHKII